MAKHSKYCALAEYTEYTLDNSLLLFGDRLRGLFGFGVVDFSFVSGLLLIAVCILVLLRNL